jgi:hypothetical protein
MKIWLAENGADLIGHAITILTFLVGLVLLRHKARIDLRKALTMKSVERSVDALRRSTSLMEVIKAELALLAIRPFDRNAPLDAATERHLRRILLLRARWFGTTLFLPSALRAKVDAVNGAFEVLSEAVTSSDPAKWKSGVDAATNEVSNWRNSALQWLSEQSSVLEV